MPSGEEDFADAMVEVEGAAIQALRHRIVIEVPANAGGGAGVHTQARHDRGKAAGACQERYPCELLCGGKNIPLAHEECATKVAVHKIFLRDLPTDDLARRLTAFEA